MNKHISANIRGFTLIEMVIALVIGSLILTAALSLAKPFFAQQQRERTIDSVQMIDQAMADYFERFGSYPCPAPLGTARGTAEDGQAFCDNPPTQATITRVDGRPDSLGVPRDVLIGAIPYRDLGIPVESTLDAYSNRFTYAVSLLSTDPALYNDGDDLDSDGEFMDDHTGAIEVRDTVSSLLENTSTTEIEAGSAHFFYFSHGRDGKGAYTNMGTLAASPACTPANGDDFENCNADATFIASLQSHGGGNMYYDDVSAYSLLLEGEEDDERLWRRIPANPDSIRNVNALNIGIGTNDPQQTLHVAGNTLIEGSLNAQEYLQTGEGNTGCDNAKTGAIRHGDSPVRMQYCNGSQWVNFTTGNCSNGEVSITNNSGVTECKAIPNCTSSNRALRFNQSSNAFSCGTINVTPPSVNVSCGDGMVLRAISNNAPVCVPMVAQPGPPVTTPGASTCPNGFFMTGIQADGSIICTAFEDIFSGELPFETFLVHNTPSLSPRATCPSDSIRVGCASWTTTESNDTRGATAPGLTQNPSGAAANGSCSGPGAGGNAGSHHVWAICMRFKN